MPTLRTPLVGSYNRRSFNNTQANTLDQLNKACVLTKIVNKKSNTVTFYVEKRSGINLFETVEPGAIGYGCFTSLNTSSNITVYKLTNTCIYNSTTNYGVLVSGGAPLAVRFYEATFSGISYVMVAVATSASSGTGWFLASDSNVTQFTANRTAGSVQLAAVSSFTGRYIGQLLSGTGIDPAARIASMNIGASTIDMTIAASSGAATPTTITPEGVAKIIDPDFPTDIIGGFVELDGWVGIQTYSSKVFNSDLNNLISWQPGNYLTTSKYSDVGIGLSRYKNYIVAFSAASIEFLYNAGNLSGSPFSSADNLAIGANNVPSTFYTPSQNILIDGTLYWGGNDNALYKLNGQTPQKIETVGMTMQLVGPITPFSYNAQSFLNVPCAIGSGVSKNYWYCVDTDSWSEPNLPASPAYFGGQGNSRIVLGNTSGISYFLSLFPNATTWTFQDNGSSYTMSIQIQTDMGTNKRKFASELRLICDVQSSGAIDVSYSDDDGASFSTAISIPVTSIAAMFIPGSMLGSWEGTRLWKFEDAGNNAQRIKLLEIDYEVEG